MLGSVIHAGQTYRIAEIASDDFKVSGQTPKDFGFSFANSIDLSLFSEGRIPIDRRIGDWSSRSLEPRSYRFSLCRGQRPGACVQAVNSATGRADRTGATKSHPNSTKGHGFKPRQVDSFLTARGPPVRACPAWATDPVGGTGAVSLNLFRRHRWA
jgi:hypothetical protein